MYDVHNNIDNSNPTRCFDGMIADIMTNETLQAITTELFIRCQRLNKSLVFITD